MPTSTVKTPDWNTQLGPHVRKMLFCIESIRNSRHKYAEELYELFCDFHGLQWMFETGKDRIK